MEKAVAADAPASVTRPVLIYQQLMLSTAELSPNFGDGRGRSGGGGCGLTVGRLCDDLDP
ncbi:hypothetical protein ABIC09_005805, partial [Bradyrhizobium sp. S3.12.5]